MSSTALAADVIVVPPAPPAPPVVIVEEPDHNFYMSIFGGLLYIQDVGVTAVFDPTTFTVGSDRGYRFGGALGFSINDTFGAEVEFTTGRVGLDTLNIEGEEPFDLTPADATARLTTIMGNLRVGFGAGALQPYVAVGAGAASVALSVPAGAIGVDGVDDKDWTWGVQAMAGVDFALTDNLTIGARYRFQHIGPTSFLDTNEPVGDPVDLDGFNTHGIEAVFTIHF
ncbi:MAG: outer membrane beta-barrel protein [Bauldia sp.]